MKRYWCSRPMASDRALRKTATRKPRLLFLMILCALSSCSDPSGSVTALTEPAGVPTVVTTMSCRSVSDTNSEPRYYVNAYHIADGGFYNQNGLIFTIPTIAGAADHPLQTVRRTDAGWFVGAPQNRLGYGVKWNLDGVVTSVTASDRGYSMKCPVSAPLDDVENLTKIPFRYYGIVYDSKRERYYASPPTFPQQQSVAEKNRLAIVDPETATVTYSDNVIGADPGLIAISADGDSLYVSFNKRRDVYLGESNVTGEIIKLGLPDLNEQWRVELPRVPGTTDHIFVQDIAVSPAEPDTIAVSLNGTSNKGLIVIRNGVIDPALRIYATANTSITFDGSGEFVYGFTSTPLQDGSSGLRRIKILSDSLLEESFSPTPNALDHAAGKLYWHADQLIVGKRVYRTPDMTPIGTVDVLSAICRPFSLSRLLCSNHPSSVVSESTVLSIAIVDSADLSVIDTVEYYRGPLSEDIGITGILPGKPGQILLRIKNGRPSSALWLLSDDKFR